jgi:hypothetical protein
MSCLNIPFAMPNFICFAPSQCLTPYVMSYYSMSNLKLYALCPISMSSKVCHVPYSMLKAKLHATCTISMSNTVCHVSYSMWNVNHAPSQCLTPYVTSHIPCRMWSFIRHVPSECLTLWHISYYMWNAKLYPSRNISMSNIVCRVS